MKKIEQIKDGLQTLFEAELEDELRALGDQDVPADQLPEPQYLQFFHAQLILNISEHSPLLVIDEERWENTYQPVGAKDDLWVNINLIMVIQENDHDVIWRKLHRYEEAVFTVLRGNMQYGSHIKDIEQGEGIYDRPLSGIQDSPYIAIVYLPIRVRCRRQQSGV